MIQTSQWLGFDEFYELNEEGIISFLKKNIEFINIFEFSRKFITSGHEKKLINSAKNKFHSILKMIKSPERLKPLLEDECEALMKATHEILIELIEFAESEFLN